MQRFRMGLGLTVAWVLVWLAGRAVASAQPTSDDEDTNGARLDLKRFAQVPGMLRSFAGWASQREFTRMLLGLADGSAMSGRGGWWGPGKGRYDLKWLAKR